MTHKVTKFFNELLLDDIAPDVVDIFYIEKWCYDIIDHINKIKDQHPTLDHSHLFQYVLKARDAVKDPYNFLTLDPKEKGKCCWIVYPEDKNKRYFVRIGDKIIQGVELMKMYHHDVIKLNGEAVTLRESCPKSCINPDHARFISMIDVRRKNMAKAREALK